MAQQPEKASAETKARSTKPTAGFLGQVWKFLVPVGIGVVLWFLPTPDGLQVKAWHMFAVFVATIAGIMTSPLPMAAVAIIGATIGVLVGVVSFADVTKSTGTDLVWLVMLGLLLLNRR